jgi:glycosyltransferase involved in cell wall biosynthesis
VSGASRLAQVVVPDTALLTWLPYLVPGALRLARRERFDCVITTSGPESVHLAGLALAPRTAWIADLRDGWGFETLHSWPTGAQERLDEWLERRVARRADLMTAVSDPMAADLRERLGADAYTVTNGFDPEEVPPRTGSHPLLDPARRSLVHTGRMASSQRSPAPLLEAVRLLRGRGAAAARGLQLVFAGPLTAEERALLEAPDLAGMVRHVGNLDREEALRLQREADGLVLLTAGTRRGEATGKLYEYLGAERPILVLGDDTEAARIVREAAAGEVAPAGDPEAIAAALERLPSETGGAPQAYSYPELARRFAELIELARKARR